MNAFKNVFSLKKLKGKVKDKQKKGKKGEVCQEDEEPELTWNDPPADTSNTNGPDGAIDIAVDTVEALPSASNSIDKNGLNNWEGSGDKHQVSSPAVHGYDDYIQGTSRLRSPNSQFDKGSSLQGTRVVPGGNLPKGQNKHGLAHDDSGTNDIDITFQTSGYDIGESDTPWTLNLGDIGDLSAVVDCTGAGLGNGNDEGNDNGISEGNGNDNAISGGSGTFASYGHDNGIDSHRTGYDKREDNSNEESNNEGNVDNDSEGNGFDISISEGKDNQFDNGYGNVDEVSDEYTVDTSDLSDQIHGQFENDQYEQVEGDSRYIQNGEYAASNLHLDLPSSDEEVDDSVASDDHMPNGVAGGGSNGSGAKAEPRLIGLREERDAQAEAKANLTSNTIKGSKYAGGGTQNFTKTETHTIEQVQAGGEDVLKVTKSVTETRSGSHSKSDVTGDVTKKTVNDGTKEVTVINEGQKTTVIKHETSTTSNASKLRSPSKLPTLGSSKESPKRTAAAATEKTNAQKKPSPRSASAGTPKSSPRPASATPKDSPRSKLDGREIKRPMTSPQKGTSPRTASAGSAGSSDGKSPRGAYGAVGSKCGSKANIHHSPGGGNVKIESKKMAYKEVAKSKVGSLNNATHKPGGGDKKIREETKLTWKAESKVGSMNNATHKAGGGEKKGDDVVIFSEKCDWEAKSKIRSFANVNHKPRGGNVQITDEKVAWDGKSKIRSFTNVKHTPKGGDIEILDQKLSWEAKSKVRSLDNAKHKPKGGDIVIMDEKVNWETKSKVGSLQNVKHQPKGGNVQIIDQKLEWEKKAKTQSINTSYTPKGGDIEITNVKLEWEAKSKVGSLANVTHRPSGGDIEITDEKLEWDAKSKIGSFANVQHTPGGGDIEIIDEKLEWETEAKIRSLDNVRHTPNSSEVEIESHKLDFKEKAASKVGSKDNITHKAGGGTKK